MTRATQHQSQENGQDEGDPGARVRERARALGFDVVGVARADVPLGVDHDRYLAFVAEGRHGAMGYLAEHARRGGASTRPTSWRGRAA